jgi:hypothetical protein
VPGVPLSELEHGAQLRGGWVSVRTVLCNRCGRERLDYKHDYDRCTPIAYATAKHDGYGCSTGCCGHVIRLHAANGDVLQARFCFGHPQLTQIGDSPPSNLEEWVIDAVMEEYKLAGLAECPPIRLAECELLDD